LPERVCSDRDAGASLRTLVKATGGAGVGPSGPGSWLWRTARMPFELPLDLNVFQQTPSVVLLQAAAPAAGAGINAAGAISFFTAILALAQAVGLPAFGVSAAWAGFQLMFSTSPRHQDGAKEQLKWSVIGLVLILAANQIADVVKQAAGATGGGG
jgi:hypothetical protein